METCIICLSKVNEPVKPDTCKHIFCKRCFEVYIQSFDHCPTCKIKFNQIQELYDINLIKKKKNGLFDGNLEDKLYRFQFASLPEEHCLVCKKKDNKEYLITCDRCFINQSHYYCDLTPGIAFNCYICPICRNKFYKKFLNRK